MDQEIILGQIRESWFADDHQIVLLEPLYSLNESTGAWEPIDDIESKFPNRGRITWVKPAEDALVNSVWTFTYEPHPSFDPHNPRHDRYRINWNRPPEPPFEVLDLQVADADAAFRELDRGLMLRFVPSRSVYIVLDGQTWAGPVKLVQENGRWVLDAQQRRQPVPKVRALPTGQLEQIYVDARRTFLRPNAPIPLKVGELEWAPDDIVLKRLLKTIRTRADVDESLRLTKAAVQRIINTLPGGEREILTQQVMRAQRYLADVERVQRELSAFEAELLALPSVAARIAAAEAEGRAAAKAQAEAALAARAKAELEATRQEHGRLTEALARSRQELELAEQKARDAERRAQDAMDAELARRRQELEALDKAIAERQQQLDAELGLADAAIRERIAELIARPADALAQIAIVRAALGVPGALGVPTAPAAAQIAPPPTALLNGESDVKDQEHVVRAARKAAAAAGEPSSLGVVLHSALVSGLMPLLCGPGALDILERYARAVVGRRMVWVVVPPIALEPADLLGRLDARTGRLVPHPGGLLDLLIFAGQPEQRDRLFLAVLDGVNRAAADAYLLPILACYATAWDESTGRALPIVHPSALPPADPYASAAQLTWPRNVLLAGTLVEGGATVPLPPALWSQALLINTGEARVSEQPKDNSALQLTGVSPQMWASWRELASADLQSGVLALDEISADGLRLPAPVARAFARAYAASRPWLKDNIQALTAAACGILAPYALATGQAEALSCALADAEIKVGERDLAKVRHVVV